MAHSSSQDSISLSLPQKIASAGLAGCTADLVTFPLDTVKVWLQVRGEAAPANKVSLASQFTTPSIDASKRAMSSLTSSVTSGKVQPKDLHKNSLTLNKSRKSLLTEQADLQLQQRKKFATNKNASITGHAHKFNSEKSGLAKKKQPTNFSQPNFVGSSRSGSSTSSLQSRSNPGLFGTMARNVRVHGFFSLYGGLAAGLQRQVAFCAVRIGLYDNVKGFYQRMLPGSQNGKQIGHRILAGTTTAFIAVGLFQPTEVVKIRMQAQTSKPPEARLYSSSFHAYRALFKVGVKEAWKGLETNAARLAVVNVCELVTYDVVKETILDFRLMKDNPACHFTSAFISGFITTVVASPIDVVKTRYMNSKEGRYKGPIHCAKTMLVGEGVKAFYKGFVPAYLRLGSWNIVMFVSYEQYKRAFHQYNKTNTLTSQKKTKSKFVTNAE